MINIGSYETCVCKRRSVPHSLCNGVLEFEEKGKKIKLVPRNGEEAKAVVIDGCVCNDNNKKCDGIFLLRSNNKNYMILVELKGKNIEHAFEQLAYVRKHRPEYTELKQLFMENQPGSLRHEAFIVSNFVLKKVEHQKLENTYNIRVKGILHSEATKPVPDIRTRL